MLNLEKEKTKQLLTITQKLGRSSEETTQTVQKIKAINESLVEITQKQYNVVNRVFADGEHIKSILAKSVSKTDSSLAILNETVRTIESGFNRIEESIHLFDKIKESTQSLNKVARHTKMLALNTAVLGGSLGGEGSGINIVANEMQDLVQSCEEASKHIDEVVSAARNNVQEIVEINRNHIQAGIESTASVEQSLKMLIKIFKGSEDDSENQEASVEAIITAVGSIEKLAQQARQIADDTQSKTEVLNNEVEVSNQAVSDLVGVVTDTPITNISPNDASDQLASFRVIDVRRPNEFNDHLGHISSAKLCTINEKTFKKKLASLNKEMQYLFVCRSGGRSSRAARTAQSLGFGHIFNLDGGMLAWDKCRLPVERN
jgi:rhodanese-related sulfurtransferase/methyl-accepting chemotaxis protein